MSELSLRFTTVNVFGDMRTSRTEYVRGRNTRSESRSCNGHRDATPPFNVRYEYGPLRAYIHNRDLGYRFEVEPEKSVYTATRVHRDGGPVWMKPGHVEPREASGKTIHNLIETTDTRERKEIFGYTARRVVTKTRQTRDGELLSESECDGWYIDPPAAWLNLYPPNPGVFHVLAAGPGKRDDYTFEQIGKREMGFVLLANRWPTPLVVRDEVTELSEAPLDPGLFVPPRNYRRVPQLENGVRYPLPHRMRLRWEIFRDSLILPSRIEKFTA